MFVSLYTNLPYEYKSEGDYIPLKAYELLESKNLIPENDKAYILNHTVDLSVLNRSESQVNEDGVVHEEAKINRNTTFKDLLDMGIEKKSIVHVIGGEYSSPIEPVSTYCQSNDLKFGDIKSQLQILVDDLQ